MSHEHNVYDVNEALVIDAISKTITNPTGKKIVLAQYDHNSQRVTCKIPRYIEDHDMLACDEVQIHYNNVSSGTSVSARSTNTGVYEIADLTINPEDESTIICTWLISQNATQYAGVVKFKLKFICYGSDDVADYVWNTNPSTDIIEVYAGFDNAEAIIEQYADIIEQWKQGLIEVAARYKGEISKAELIRGSLEKEVGDIYKVTDADVGPLLHIWTGKEWFPFCKKPSSEVAEGDLNAASGGAVYDFVTSSTAALKAEINEDLQALDTRITANTETLSEAKEFIVAHHGEIVENRRNIADLTDRVDTHDGNIADLDTRITENADNITGAQRLIANNTRDIAEIVGRVDAHDGNIADLDTRITANTETLSEAKEFIAAYYKDIAENRRNIADLTDRVDAHDAEIEALKASSDETSSASNFIDTVTGETYMLSVVNGKLTLTKIGG